MLLELKRISLDIKVTVPILPDNLKKAVPTSLGPAGFFSLSKSQNKAMAWATSTFD